MHLYMSILNDTDQSPESFLFMEILCKEQRNLLKTLLNSLKNHAKDLDLFFHKKGAYKVGICFNMHVWSTKDFLKDNTELLANCLFSMYFHVFS